MENVKAQKGIPYASGDGTFNVIYLARYLAINTRTSSQDILR